MNATTPSAEQEGRKVSCRKSRSRKGTRRCQKRQAALRDATDRPKNGRVGEGKDDIGDPRERRSARRKAVKEIEMPRLRPASKTADAVRRQRFVPRREGAEKREAARTILRIGCQPTDAGWPMEHGAAEDKTDANAAAGSRGSRTGSTPKPIRNRVAFETS